MRGSGDGVELCDNLIVFGNSVIVISDKTIEFQKNAKLDVAWRRWYNRAIQKSVDQINGAIRWLSDFPDRIFIDKQCNTALPVNIPNKEDTKFYAISVVGGVEGAIRDFYNEDEGGLILNSYIKGGDHGQLFGALAPPFSIGDVNPGRTFVHVFDALALNRIFSELDTAPDLIDYLEEREKAFRRNRLLSCHNESDLMAFYLMNEKKDGTHFIISDENANYDIILEGGFDRALKKKPEYKAKIAADNISYAWDNLISRFSESLTSGTSVVLAGEEPTIAFAEPALRLMAQETRFARRTLSNAFIDAVENVDYANHNRFARIVFSEQQQDGRSAIYVFLVMKYEDWMDDEGGYDAYRALRAKTLSTYCYKVLLENRTAQFSVGIGVDVPGRFTGRQGGSEDLIAVSVENWTDELIEEIRSDCAELQILDDPNRQQRWRYRDQEFPDVSDKKMAKSKISNRKKRKRKRLFRP